MRVTDHLPCREVHDDIHRVIKYSVEEMLSQDAAKRALRFWVESVEPLFGLPPRATEPVKVTALAFSVT